MTSQNFEQISHASHENWYEKQHPDPEKRLAAFDDWLWQKENQVINYWIHEKMLEMTKPLHQKGSSWLTVGDGYGFDAHYLKEEGCQATATDIAGTFLPIAMEKGFVSAFSVQNAEKMTFADNSFEYALCKEAYHHFPRPFMAVYEMLRVVKNAVVLIEPHDPISKMPFLLALRNIFDKIDTNLLQKYWKNRYSFETVGNYVFKLSEREMEKLAMGLNLPAVAFKGINNSYFNPATAREKADKSSAAFRKILKRKRRDDFLSKTGLIPYQLLCAVIFKTLPDEKTIKKLKKDGFMFYRFPENPYLKK
jgi:ubiquinone/menaquinone biosynthesis C-methylase UbiE